MATGYRPSRRPPHEVDEQLNLIVPPISKLYHQNSIQPLTRTFAETLQNKIPSSILAQPFKPFSVDRDTLHKANLLTHSQFIFGDFDSKHSNLLKPIVDYCGKKAIIFQKADKDRLLNKIQHVLLGKFSHGRPPIYAIKDFFFSLKLKGSYNISLFDSKHLYIECELPEDYTRIWLEKLWIVKGFQMRIFKWCAEFTPRKESPIAPIWVHLYGLPLYLFEKEALLSIAYAIGNPLLISKDNLNRSNLSCASFCVELDVTKQLLDEIWIEFGKDMRGSNKHSEDIRDGFWQKVEYGYIPQYCTFCAHIDHSLETCKQRTLLSPKESYGSLEKELNNLAIASSTAPLEPAGVITENVLIDSENATGKELPAGELVVEALVSESREHGAGYCDAGEAAVPGVSTTTELLLEEPTAKEFGAGEQTSSLESPGIPAMYKDSTPAAASRELPFLQQEGTGLATGQIIQGKTTSHQGDSWRMDGNIERRLEETARTDQLVMQAAEGNNAVGEPAEGAGAAEAAALQAKDTVTAGILLGKTVGCLKGVKQLEGMLVKSLRIGAVPDCAARVETDPTTWAVTAEHTSELQDAAMLDAGAVYAMGTAADAGVDAGTVYAMGTAADAGVEPAIEADAESAIGAVNIADKWVKTDAVYAGVDLLTTKNSFAVLDEEVPIETLEEGEIDDEHVCAAPTKMVVNAQLALLDNSRYIEQLGVHSLDVLVEDDGQHLGQVKVGQVKVQRQIAGHLYAAEGLLLNTNCSRVNTQQDGHSNRTGTVQLSAATGISEVQEMQNILGAAEGNKADAHQEEAAYGEQVSGKTSGGILECRNSHTASITPRKLSGAAAEFTPKWAVLVEELVEGKKQSENEQGEESLQQVYDRIKKMNRGKIGSKKGNLIRPTVPHRAKDETDSQNMDNTFVAKANTSKGSKSNGFIDYEKMMSILRRPSRRDRDNPSLKRTSTCDTNDLGDFILPLEVDSEPSSPASRNSHFMDE